MRIFNRFVLFIVLFVLLKCALFGQWTYFTPQPTARWGHTCASYNGLVYSVSGLGWTNFEVYNPATNTWATLAPIPIGVAYAAVSGWNGKIYVMGGYTGSASTLHQIYTISTNTWSTGAALPIAGYGVASVAYLGKIYVAGGYNGSIYGNTQIYDVALNTWSVGTPMAIPRYEHGIGLIGNMIYVFGGNTAGGASATLEAYNISTNTWASRAPMINARYIHAAASDGVLLHSAGGYPVNANYETYNPATNTWTARAPMQVSRYRLSGAAANSCFYAVAGFNGSVAMNTMEGFCGFVILHTRDDFNLVALEIDGRVKITWNLPIDLFDRNWQVERSLNGPDFEVIGSGKFISEWWDDQPFGMQVWYRVSSIDQDGQKVQSNIGQVTISQLHAHQFSYNQNNAQLEFMPATSEFGTANLWSMDGKLLLQEVLRANENSHKLSWSLAAFPAGIYSFTYVSKGKPFQNKVVHLGN